MMILEAGQEGSPKVIEKEFEELGRMHGPDVHAKENSTEF